jgi:hypothetical protein
MQRDHCLSCNVAARRQNISESGHSTRGNGANFASFLFSNELLRLSESLRKRYKSTSHQNQDGGRRQVLLSCYIQGVLKNMKECEYIYIKNCDYSIPN